MKHCPGCLSRTGVYRLIWAADGRCSCCGEVPAVQLTPREIRLCIRGREAGVPR